MPSPIAHAVTGVAVFFAFVPRSALPSCTSRTVLLGTCLLFAVLPDLDFLPGLLIGNPNRFHQGPSHSLFIATLAGLGAFLIMNRHRATFLPGIASSTLLVCTLASAISHPLLDLLILDTTPPHGIPLFWPLDQGYYSSPWPLFWNVERANVPGPPFFYSLFTMHNLHAAIREILFGLGLMLLVAGSRQYRKPAWPWILSGIAILCTLVGHPPGTFPGWGLP